MLYPGTAKKNGSKVTQRTRARLVPFTVTEDGIAVETAARIA